MAVDLTYPTNLNKFRERRNERNYLFPLMATLPSHFASLSTCTSMLCVGPGPGEYELQLIELCLPSLKKFVGVEQDEYCSSELEKNLKERFGDRLEYEIVKESMETWKSSQKFDLVMASHCLYNVEKVDRKKLFKKVLNDWLCEDGLFLLVNMSNKYENGRSLNVMQNIHSLLHRHMGRLLEAEEVLEEAEEVGAQILFAQRYECQMDFRHFDDDVTFIFNLSAIPPLTSQQMKQCIDDLHLSNGIGQYFGKLAVLRKK